MTKHTMRAVLAIGTAGALMLAGGCGTSTDHSTNTKTSHSADPNPTAMGQAEWSKKCAPGGSEPNSQECKDDKKITKSYGQKNFKEDKKDSLPSDSPPLDESDDDSMAYRGDWGKFPHESFDGESTGEWKARIVKDETVSSIPDGMDNPDWDGGETGEYQAATTDSTHVFHHYTLELKNIGDIPTDTMMDFELIDAQGRSFVQTSNDSDEIDYTLNERNDRDLDDEVNPGETVKQEVVVTTKKSVKPLFMTVGDNYPLTESDSSGPVLLVLLSKSDMKKAGF